MVVTDTDFKVGRTGDCPDTVSAAPARTGRRAAGPVDGDLPGARGKQANLATGLRRYPLPYSYASPCRDQTGGAGKEGHEYHEGDNGISTFRMRCCRICKPGMGGRRRAAPTPRDVHVPICWRKPTHHLDGHALRHTLHSHSRLGE